MFSRATSFRFRTISHTICDAIAHRMNDGERPAFTISSRSSTSLARTRRDPDLSCRAPPWHLAQRPKLELRSFRSWNPLEKGKPADFLHHRRIDFLQPVEFDLPALQSAS